MLFSIFFSSDSDTKKNEETVTVELSQQFKQIVSTAVSKFVSDRKDDRFAEELEFFCCVQIQHRRIWYFLRIICKKGQKEIDYDILRWIQQKVNLMKIKNTCYFLNACCLNLGNQIDYSCVCNDVIQKLITN